MTKERERITRKWVKEAQERLEIIRERSGMSEERVKIIRERRRTIFSQASLFTYRKNKDSEKPGT